MSESTQATPPPIGPETTKKRRGRWKIILVVVVVAILLLVMLLPTIVSSIAPGYAVSTLNELLHGTIWEVACLSCAARWPTAQILAREEEDPACELCGGLLKSATVSFGQSLDPAVVGAAVRWVATSDLLVAIGTSLQVNPVARLAGMADRLAIVNAEPTPYDEVADVIVRDPISDVLQDVRGSLA